MAEVKCPACGGTGFSAVEQPSQPGRKIFPAPCKECHGKLGLPRGDGECGVLCQSVIGMMIASIAMPGACSDIPRHDAIVRVDFPTSVRSTLSIPNTDNCPGVCRWMAISAVNSSPV